MRTSSGTLSPCATERRLFELCISDFIVDELERTPKKSYFVSRLPDQGTAVSAQADYLVSRDKAVLAVGQFQGIPILTARQLYDILQQRP
jgi:predicted nucleic acid-binding protein